MFIIPSFKDRSILYSTCLVNSIEIHTTIKEGCIRRSQTYVSKNANDL